MRGTTDACMQASSASRGANVKVRDVMSPQVSTVKDSDSVQAAAARMAKLDVGALPVTDAGGTRMTGFLTDRDIAVRLAAKGSDPRATLVESIKTAETPRYVFEDEPVDRVAANMCVDARAAVRVAACMRAHPRPVPRVSPSVAYNRELYRQLEDPMATARMHAGRSSRSGACPWSTATSSWWASSAWATLVVSLQARTAIERRGRCIPQCDPHEWVEHAEPVAQWR